MCRPIFFFTAPLRKPRTEWGCQPVAFLSSGSEAPAGLRSSARILAVLVPRRGTAGGLLGPFGCLADLPVLWWHARAVYSEVVWGGAFRGLLEACFSDVFICVFPLWRQVAASPFIPPDAGKGKCNFAFGGTGWRRKGDPPSTVLCREFLKLFALPIPARLAGDGTQLLLRDQTGMFRSEELGCIPGSRGQAGSR